MRLRMARNFILDLLYALLLFKQVLNIQVYLIPAQLRKSKTQMETKELERNNKISKIRSGQITIFYGRSLYSIQYVRKKISLYQVNIFIDFSEIAFHPEKLLLKEYTVPCLSSPSSTHRSISPSIPFPISHASYPSHQ